MLLRSLPGRMHLGIKSLLRVLQENEFERVGEDQTRQVDVRIVAATKHNLRAGVKEARFREDLHFRLILFLIDIPPLGERCEDMPALTNLFLQNAPTSLRGPPPSLSTATLHSLQEYAWLEKRERTPERNRKGTHCFA